MSSNKGTSLGFSKKDTKGGGGGGVGGAVLAGVPLDEVFLDETGFETLDVCF